MTVALIIGLLFLCGTAYNLFAEAGTPANALVTLVLAGIFFATHLFTRRQEQELERFAGWLMQNAEQVQASGEYYGNVLINGISWNQPRDSKGRIQLERTGPFVPPITFPDSSTAYPFFFAKAVLIFAL